jgi:hypothetical protein
MSRYSDQWFTLQGRHIEALVEEYRNHPNRDFWQGTYVNVMRRVCDPTYELAEPEPKQEET